MGSIVPAAVGGGLAYAGLLGPLGLAGGALLGGTLGKIFQSEGDKKRQSSARFQQQTSGLSGQSYLDMLKQKIPNFTYNQGSSNLPDDIRLDPRFRQLYDQGTFVPGWANSTASSGGSRGSEGSHSSSGGSVTRDYIQSQMDASSMAKDYAKGMYDAYAAFAPQYMSTQMDALKKLYPNMSVIGDELAGDVRGRLGGEYQLPDWMTRQFQERVRGAQSDRGMLSAGRSPYQEALGLGQMSMAMRDQDVSTALALTGMMPKVNAPVTIPGQMGPQVTDYYGMNLQAGLQEQSMAQQMEIARMNQQMQQQQLGLQSQELAQRQSQFNQSQPNWYDPIIGGVSQGVGSWLLNSLF